MKTQVDRILINVPKELKVEFSSVCGDLNVTMTQALIASINKFIKEAKNKNK